MSAIGINDLNPSESTVNLAGKSYTLKPFSLFVQVWAHDEFATESEPNGLTNLSHKLMELDAGAIAKTCYFLLKDKSDFPTCEKFINALGDNYAVVKVLLEPLSRCLGVSQPTSDDTANEIELKK